MEAPVGNHCAATGRVTRETPRNSRGTRFLTADMLLTYLRTLAGSGYGKAYFLSVAKKTTGIASINKTQLSAFPVPLPPVPLQRTFELRVRSAESILRQQADALNKATATFDAILSRAFA